MSDEAMSDETMMLSGNASYSNFQVRATEHVGQVSNLPYISKSLARSHATANR